MLKINPLILILNVLTTKPNQFIFAPRWTINSYNCYEQIHQCMAELLLKQHRGRMHGQTDGRIYARTHNMKT